MKTILKILYNIILVPIIYILMFIALLFMWLDDLYPNKLSEIVVEGILWMIQPTFKIEQYFRKK